ncbi:Camk/camkl protein kinase, partial [Globisporangium splendens]
MQQYESLSTIATALYGRVDKCRHRETQELVAVKRMELSFAGRKRAKESNRVVQEDVFAELSANLKIQALGGHAFVLPMKDCFVEQEVVQLVMAYCPNGELLNVVNTNRATLSTAQLLRYFKQVLLAMNFLHTNGIAHRDVSLENVLVDENDCCQVCDFGLATSAPSMKSSPVGKVHYMAPEACSTREEWYSPIKADVWSLGVMLFSMIAGRYPFREPLRRDDHFRLLVDFGMEYLLEKFDVDMQDKPEVVDLLRQFFIMDATKRPSVGAILKHKALTGIDCSVGTALAQNVVSTPSKPITSSAVVNTPVIVLQDLAKQPESSQSSTSTEKRSCALITPSVSTIHPMAKSTKEHEVFQAELPESSSNDNNGASRPKPTKRELFNRTVLKFFRKKRDE